MPADGPRRQSRAAETGIIEVSQRAPQRPLPTGAEGLAPHDPPLILYEPPCEGAKHTAKGRPTSGLSEFPLPKPFRRATWPKEPHPVGRVRRCSGMGPIGMGDR